MSLTATEYRALCLDACSLIEATSRGDDSAALAMLATFANPEDAGQLIAALTRVALSFLNVTAGLTGIPPDKLMGHVVDSIRDAPC